MSNTRCGLAGIGRGEFGGGFGFLGVFVRGLSLRASIASAAIYPISLLRASRKTCVAKQA